MIAPSTPITPEQLLAMPDSESLEIVRGKLVEKNVGFESSEIALILGSLLLTYCRKHKLGRMGAPDAAFQCFPDDPTKVRKPDLAFVSYARWPANKRIGAYCKVAPDLAVEILSPNDVTKETSDKVKEYLTVGVQQVWIVNEFLRQVEVYSLTDSPKVFSIGDDLTADPVLPGFACPVSEIFSGIPDCE